MLRRVLQESRASAATGDPSGREHDGKSYRGVTCGGGRARRAPRARVESGARAPAARSRRSVPRAGAACWAGCSCGRWGRGLGGEAAAAGKSAGRGLPALSGAVRLVFSGRYSASAAADGAAALAAFSFVSVFLMLLGLRAPCCVRRFLNRRGSEVLRCLFSQGEKFWNLSCSGGSINKLLRWHGAVGWEMLSAVTGGHSHGPERKATSGGGAAATEQLGDGAGRGQGVGWQVIPVPGLPSRSFTLIRWKPSPSLQLWGW